MKKKILYIGNKLSKHGNTATSIETLGEFLENEGYTVYYSSSKKNKLLRLMHMVFSTFKYAGNVDYVLIDTYSTSNFWYAFIISQLCRLLRVKYITKLHGGNLPNRIKNNPFFCDMIFNNAYAITAPSAYLMDCFAKRNYKNLLFVPNTIDISKYPYKERVVNIPKLLWVRSFSSIYNPKMAIKVMYELKKEFPKTQLCMVGPDKENLIQECVDFAKELDVAVTFTGKLSKEEWITLSNDYTVFINTTHFDNTPISLIEAMAIGLPIISTNVGGIPFLIQHNVNALLVNDDAVPEMVDAVKYLMGNDAHTLELLRNSRKMVEGYDWQIIKHFWFDLLK
jgi:glycosyltransferase involved in cell wall biosynthesis